MYCGKYDSMKIKKIAHSCLGLIITGTLISLPCSAMADWQINMPRGVTPISHDIYNLHMVTMAICAVIGLIVYSALIFIVIRFRRKPGVKPASFVANSTLENIWTVIPLLILMGMAVPSTLTLMDMYDDADSDLTIKITGSQWQWHYAYLDQGIQFYSKLSTPPQQIQGSAKKNQWYLLEVDKPLVLPVNKKVRFLVTSEDVIHSWWVPDFGIKRDAIPGFIHESWARIMQPGVYRGQCAELCGIDHAFMPIVVKALSTEQFDQWLVEQKQAEQPIKSGNWDMATAMQTGETQYLRYCAACHQQDGSGIPPMYPALTESSIVVGDPVNRHIDLVLHGVAGSAMQAYAEQLSNHALAAIITYERNAWDHKTGDLITPEQVQARRATTSQLEYKQP